MCIRFPPIPRINLPSSIDWYDVDNESRIQAVAIIADATAPDFLAWYLLKNQPEGKLRKMPGKTEIVMRKPASVVEIENVCSN